MPITERELIAGFAQSVAVGDASVFLGAGMSRGAKLPDWEGLIAPARLAADVPKAITDAPLAAEYMANEKSHSWLAELIRVEIDKPVVPTPSHLTLARLPIRDYWTTNYDNVIELSLDEVGEQYQRIVKEDDYQRDPAATGAKRITKMHGSLSRPDASGRSRWEELPVIARSHFERYEELHPITWTRLRATWLTNRMLFLGFSFDDPNLNLLLRLSRSLPVNVGAPRHFAVFSEKHASLEKRLQELRINDLETSGVSVHIVKNHDEIESLLERLEVRSRKPMLFLSGRLPDEAKSVAQSIAAGLANVDEDGFTLVSFGGDAAIAISKEFRDLLPPDNYEPERIRFYFRKAVGDESLKIPNRAGMAIFTEKELPAMREFVFPQVRALLVINGGPRTQEEVDVALAKNVAVIPVAATGGAALDLWNASAPEDLGIDLSVTDANWQMLNSDQPHRAAQAAVALVKLTMFD